MRTNNIPRIKLRRLAIVLALFGLIELTMLTGTFGTQGVQALSAPTTPAQAYYVTPDWSIPIHYNGVDTHYAYQIGYSASLGQPATDSVILLAFGRQDDPTGGWGVCLTHLPCSTGYRTDGWVVTVATDFMQGYSAGHSSTSTIMMGTSNDDDIDLPAGTDHGWDCTEGGTVGSHWQPAGVVWDGLVASITAPTHVIPASGNDIEAWRMTGNSWSPCGDGIEKWYIGYDSGTTVPPQYNFGDEAYVENSSQWTQSQVYDASYGLPPALALPEIYCDSGGPNWQALTNLHLILYSGVTSDNYGSNISGCVPGTPYPTSTPNTLTYLQSWNLLNTDLTETPTVRPDAVLQDSTAFNLPIPTPLPTSTP